VKYLVRQADAADIPRLLELREEAARWLAERGSDQWAQAWPDDGRMRQTIARSVEAGHTWCVEDEYDTVVATLTTDQRTFPGLWTAVEEAEPAWYVHRLIVSRSADCPGLGSQLLDWAGSRAAEAGARWIRVDVWTTNDDLQRYYQHEGFEHVRTVVRDDYPSGALLQRTAKVCLTPKLRESA
jgi:ribosomal protein S18 acetylase RimI-like enzyme